MKQNYWMGKGQGLVLVISMALTFILLWWIISGVLNDTGGIFMYPLDDTFIHMELARNLAFHQTWGINPGEFGSASSSLLYTVLLALSFSLFGVSVTIPFIINCIAAIALLVVLQRWLQKQLVPASIQIFILLVVIFFTPLPMIILSGMEHTIQCLVSFLFLTRLAGWFEEATEGNMKRGLPVSIYVYALLLPSIRYEGLFLVGVACTVLLFYKKFAQALLLGLVSLVPIIIFALFSLTKGSYPLPNSVLVKSENLPLSAGGFLYYISNILIEKLTTARTGITALATQRLLILLPLAYFIFRKQVARNSSYFFMLVVLIFTTLLHLSFASTGWFYRYEAYLVLCSLVVLCTMIYRYGKASMGPMVSAARLMAALLLFVLLFPLVLRSTAGFTKARQACINIYEQQYQMGNLLREHYNRDVVAANDIGAISFLTEARIFDLWGLGNTEVARSRKKNYWTPEFLDSTSRKAGARIAIVYDSWFPDSLLHRWNKVAVWQVNNNVILGDDKVSFYALDPAEAPALRQRLQSFEGRLPKTVKVTYE